MAKGRKGWIKCGHIRKKERTSTPCPQVSWHEGKVQGEDQNYSQLRSSDHGVVHHLSAARPGAPNRRSPDAGVNIPWGHTPLLAQGFRFSSFQSRKFLRNQFLGL